jgi:hypothetical protein
MQPVLDAVHAGSGLLAVIALVLAVLCLVAALVVARRTRAPVTSAPRERWVEDPGLDEAIRNLVARVDAIVNDERLADQRLDVLEAHARRAVHRVGLVRFNPFNDTGGNQSFALALLDADANGLVLSSLHSRAATRVYVKQIQAGRADFGLSSEEAEALRQAGLATDAYVGPQ